MSNNKKSLVEELNSLNLTKEELKSSYDFWRSRKHHFTFDDLVDYAHRILYWRRGEKLRKK